MSNGVGGVTGLDGPRSVAVSLDGHHVYVASQLGHALQVFTRDGATGCSPSSRPRSTARTEWTASAAHTVWQ